MKPISVDADAEDELQAAWRWYEEQVRGLGAELLSAVDQKLLRIQRSPGRFPLVTGPARKFGVRRALLLGFPFAIYFTELEAELRVLAVAHQRRRPGYWRKRLGH